MGHVAGVTSLAFSPDGRYLATGSFDRTAIVWDLQMAAPVAKMFGHDDDVWRTITAMFGIAPSAAVAPAADTAYRIRIQVNGKTIRTYVKGVLVDVTVVEAAREGGIGFREGDNEQGGFAKLKVTSLEGQVLFQDDFASGLQQWINTQNPPGFHRNRVLSNAQPYLRVVFASRSTKRNTVLRGLNQSTTSSILVSVSSGDKCVLHTPLKNGLAGKE